MRKEYKTNYEFALALKILLTLPFEEKEDKRHSKDKIVEETQVKCVRNIEQSEKWKR